MADQFTVIQGAVEVKLVDADEKQHRWFLKASEVRAVDDKLFWNTNTCNNVIRRLLTHFVLQHNKEPHKLCKIISRTDVIEQLAMAKRANLREIVSGGRKSTAKRPRTFEVTSEELALASRVCVGEYTRH